MKHHARSLARWLLLAPALFVLACAFLAPAEAGRAADGVGASAPPARRAAQNSNGRASEPPPPTSTVRGRVVYDETTRPVRRARVMLVGETGARGEHAALTDARGEFRIDGVRAGTYFTFVDVPGVLSPVAFVSVDELRGGGPGVPDLGEGRAYFDLVEVDGKQDVSVTIHARRGAAIAGRVTYADGDPAVNVTVNLMRRGADGRLTKYLTGANLVSLSGFKTDDRGVYRLTGLPPGEYVVGVSESVEHSSGGKSHRRSDDIPSMLDTLTGQQFLMSYHPSATSPKEAAAVKVAAGEERDGVDVVIPERALRTVSGVVRARRDKRPLAGARVTITRRDEPAGSPPRMTYYDPNELRPHTAMTDAEGRWEFKEIPDGPYAVSVKPAEEDEPGADAATMNSRVTVGDEYPRAGNLNGGHRPPRRGRSYAPATRDVEVSGDVSEVAVELGDGARVSGVITVEGGEPPRYVGVTMARVPDGASQPGGDDQRGAEVELNRFNVEGLPAGKFFVQSTTYTDAEKNYYLKSITWKGRDLTREPLELAEGAWAEGVEIVYASNPAALRLKAVRAGDEKPAGYAAFQVVPLDAPPDAYPYSGRRLSCMTGEDGLCTIHAPPGEYRVVALPRALRRNAAADAEVARRALTSPRVTLRAGETKELEVSVPDR